MFKIREHGFQDKRCVQSGKGPWLASCRAAHVLEESVWGVSGEMTTVGMGQNEL